MPIRPPAGLDTLLVFSSCLACLTCGGGTALTVGAPAGSARTPPTFPDAPGRDEPVPDSSGWGTHVLAVERAPDGSVWVGTYGQGIYVSPDGNGAEWRNIRSGDSTSISWDFVNAFAFAPGEVWYGTVGNGWGVSKDGGRTWRNWTYDQLGPRWQYVAPDGIATAGDTVYIATADGLRLTDDDGDSYDDVTNENGLPNKYLLSMTLTPEPGGPPELRLTHLRGVSVSADGGRSWTADTAAAATPAETVTGDDLVARIHAWERVFRNYPAPAGKAARPGTLEHFWFRRPIDPEDNPRIDQTYTYGSTMGGNFQQHQGVEFNNPEGTPVHAIGDGVVVFAGKGEAGANTVAILHDRRFGRGYVWSTYYHNADLTVQAGQRVRAGDVVAHVGNTGRATNDHLHLEIHVTPGPDSTMVVDPDQRYPPYTRNAQLWIEPLPGTGAVAGRVFDSAGRPVPGARVYGVTKPLPRETPFSFAETYAGKAHSDPAFAEHFAIGDVPAGEYVLGVNVEERHLLRRVVVEAGRVTQVEFRP
jgi:murein DD-endopeptidase MepM/ murein hydrolase activator NlpD